MAQKDTKDRLGLSTMNYILLLVAVVLITIGYIVMAHNDITISPILLTFTYLVLVPLALLIRFRKKD